MIEMMKTESDRYENPGPSNLAIRPAAIQQQRSKIKVTKLKMVPTSSLRVTDNANVSCDVNPTTDVEDMFSYDQIDDKHSCLGD